MSDNAKDGLEVKHRSEFGVEFANIGVAKVPVVAYEYVLLDEDMPISEYQMLDWESRGKQLEQRDDAKDVDPLVRLSDVRAMLRREFGGDDLPDPDYDKLVIDTYREYKDEMSDRKLRELECRIHDEQNRRASRARRQGNDE